MLLALSSKSKKANVQLILSSSLSPRSSLLASYIPPRKIMLIALTESLSPGNFQCFWVINISQAPTKTTQKLDLYPELLMQWEISLAYECHFLTKKRHPPSPQLCTKNGGKMVQTLRKGGNKIAGGTLSYQLLQCMTWRIANCFSILQTTSYCTSAPAQTFC